MKMAVVLNFIRVGVCLHATEVECICEAKTHKPYKFGGKVSVATTLSRSGGQFVS